MMLVLAGALSFVFSINTGFAGLSEPLNQCEGAGLVDNTNKGAGTAPRNRTGRECLIVCLWGYASYLNAHSTLAHHDGVGSTPPQ